MRILVDTSIIVEIDRQNKDTIEILKTFVEKNVDLVISTITVSEILTGSYLQKDVKKSVITAKEVLNQFSWVDVNGEIAEKTGQLLAYLITEKKSIEYQDVVICATFLASHSDYLLTLNKKDFLAFPTLKGKVFSPGDFKELKIL